MATNDTRTVLVTGAGSGIGRAIALAFAETGARVAAADLDESAAIATAGTAGDGAMAVQADVGDVAEVDRMVSTVAAEFGHLDVMVNNAGVTRGAYIMDITENDWDRMHRINAKGVFFCLQRAAHEMIPRREGRIINIASIAGRGFPGTSNAAYAASKGAVISLTKTAAQQLARHNLNVNAICPGVTMTELVSRLISQRAAQRGVSVDEAKAAAVKPIPLRRANDPEDIAAMAVFLSLAGRPQHHRAVLQRGRRPRHELIRAVVSSTAGPHGIEDPDVDALHFHPVSRWVSGGPRLVAACSRASRGRCNDGGDPGRSGSCGQRGQKVTRQPPGPLAMRTAVGGAKCVPSTWVAVSA